MSYPACVQVWLCLERWRSGISKGGSQRYPLQGLVMIKRVLVPFRGKRYRILRHDMTVARFCMIIIAQ